LGVRHVLEVAMRRRNDPHVGLDGLIASDSFESLFLEQPQNFSLDGGRQIADLVEKDRAPRALLEFADPLPIGSGEGALFVPE
jgi:hypothetical protein